MIKIPVAKKMVKTIKIKSVLEEGFKVRTNIRDHVIYQDLPKLSGGTDTGPSPTELILAALAGCVAIVARFHADNFGIKLNKLEVEVEGDLDLRGFMGQDVKAGFHDIRIKTKVESPNSEEELKKFFEFVNAHCPIGDTIASATKISFELVKE